MTDAEIEVVDQAFAQIREFGIYLRDQDTKTLWFLNLLICILNSTLREYQHLKIGYRKYTGLLARACRNLLELDIYAQYVLISEANAKRFIGDRLIDGIDIFESFKTWITRLDPQVSTPELDDTIRRAHEQKVTEGVTSKKHLKTRELADEVGMTDEYVDMNKVCSKLVHPTAWSVLAMTDEGELGLLRPILFNTGVRYGLQIQEKIKDHVEKLGLEPKT